MTRSGKFVRSVGFENRAKRVAAKEPKKKKKKKNREKNIGAALKLQSAWI